MVEKHETELFHVLKGISARCNREVAAPSEILKEYHCIYEYL